MFLIYYGTSTQQYTPYDCALTVRLCIHEFMSTSLDVLSSSHVGFHIFIIRFNFAFGVANCHLVVYIWAVFPQHFWILYLIEAAFFLSFRLYKLSHKKPLNQVLHYLDVCWITNICCFIFFCLILFIGGPQSQLFTDLFRQEFFNLAFGTACGPLLGALIVTPLPLVFHNNETMASVFIHFFPPMQMYILRWNNTVMQEVWPTFSYDDFDFLNFWPRNGSFTGSVFGNSLIYYFCWAVPYMVFQLWIGIDLPRKYRHKKNKHTGTPLAPKYDTVFHHNMRDGQIFWAGFIFGRDKAESQRMMDQNDYGVKDFFFYICIHFIGVFLSIVVLAWLCSLSQYVHAAWILGVFLAVIVRGANRYVYYSTKMYTSLIRKQFKSLLEDPAGSMRSDANESESEFEYDEKENLFPISIERVVDDEKDDDLRVVVHDEDQNAIVVKDADKEGEKTLV